MGSEREVGVCVCVGGGRNGKFREETDGKGKHNASQEWDPFPLLRQRPGEPPGCRPVSEGGDTRLDLWVVPPIPHGVGQGG